MSSLLVRPFSRRGSLLGAHQLPQGDQGVVDDEGQQTVEVCGVRMTPGVIKFTGAFIGQTYKTSFHMQNVGERTVNVKISNPYSWAFTVSDIGKVRLSPGLKTSRVITFVCGQDCVLESTFPVQVENQKVHFPIVVSKGESQIQVVPTVLDFGMLDLGCPFVSRYLTLSNVGRCTSRFAIDLGPNKLDILASPKTGRLAPNTSVTVRVEMAGFIAGEFSDEFWVKCTPPQRVRVNVTILVPHLQACHPNRTDDFTLIEFQPTFYGCERFETLIVRNVSSEQSISITMAEIDSSHFIPIIEAQKEFARYRNFAVHPIEGRIGPFECRIFTIMFNPKEEALPKKGWSATHANPLSVDCFIFARIHRVDVIVTPKEVEDGKTLARGTTLFHGLKVCGGQKSSQVSKLFVHTALTAFAAAGKMFSSSWGPGEQDGLGPSGKTIDAQQKKSVALLRHHALLRSSSDVRIVHETVARVAEGNGAKFNPRHVENKISCPLSEGNGKPPRVALPSSNSPLHCRSEPALNCRYDTAHPTSGERVAPAAVHGTDVSSIRKGGYRSSQLNCAERRTVLIPLSLEDESDDEDRKSGQWEGARMSRIEVEHPGRPSAPGAVRLCLYGAAIRPKLAATPDTLCFGRLPIPSTADRVLRLDNPSDLLPIRFAYRKIPYLEVKPSSGLLGPRKSIELKVTLKASSCGCGGCIGKYASSFLVSQTPFFVTKAWQIGRTYFRRLLLLVLVEHVSALGRQLRKTGFMGRSFQKQMVIDLLAPSNMTDGKNLKVIVVELGNFVAFIIHKIHKYQFSRERALTAPVDIPGDETQVGITPAVSHEVGEHTEMVTYRAVAAGEVRVPDMTRRLIAGAVRTWKNHPHARVALPNDMPKSLRPKAEDKSVVRVAVQNLYGYGGSAALPKLTLVLLVIRVRVWGILEEPRRGSGVLTDGEQMYYWLEGCRLQIRFSDSCDVSPHMSVASAPQLRWRLAKTGSDQQTHSASSRQLALYTGMPRYLVPEDSEYILSEGEMALRDKTRREYAEYTKKTGKAIRETLKMRELPTPKEYPVSCKKLYQLLGMEYQCAQDCPHDAGKRANCMLACNVDPTAPRNEPLLVPITPTNLYNIQLTPNMIDFGMEIVPLGDPEVSAQGYLCQRVSVDIVPRLEVMLVRMNRASVFRILSSPTDQTRLAAGKVLPGYMKFDLRNVPKTFQPIMDQFVDHGAVQIYVVDMIVFATLDLSQFLRRLKEFLSSSKAREICRASSYFFFRIIPQYTECVETLMVENRNNFPVFITLIAPSGTAVTIPQNEIVVEKFSKVRQKIYLFLSHLGKYCTNITYVINSFHKFEIKVTANVVHRVLHVTPKEVTFGASHLRDVFQDNCIPIKISNPLTVPTRFSWKVPGSSPYRVVPAGGVVNGLDYLWCCVCRLGPPPTPRQRASSTALLQLLVHRGSVVRFKCSYTPVASANAVLLLEKINVGPVPIGIRTVKTVIMFNAGNQDLTYTTEGESRVPGVRTSPLGGVIKARCCSLINVMFTMDVVQAIDLFLEVDVHSMVRLKMHLTGYVPYPKMNFSPPSVVIRHVERCSYCSVPIVATNKSPTMALLQFKMSELVQFKVSPSSNSLDPGFGSVSLAVEPGKSVTFFLHYSPDDVTSYMFYLPMVVNRTIGPPNIDYEKSLRADTYIKKPPGDASKKRVKPGEGKRGPECDLAVPKVIAAVKIDCTVAVGKMSFSQTEFNFLLTTSHSERAPQVLSVTNEGGAPLRMGFDSRVIRDSPFSIACPDGTDPATEIIELGNCLITAYRSLYVVSR
ncbi:hypothetical protein AAG570_001992 [Ranatra chinensis]|uniref:Abnormal spindle-like microcephaly-associated protein ASH domain-containing protein n=1 Tax=Ranatra chinensis TaxID=642074 RepID=A0ABD0YP31_9HEMI